MYELLVFIHIMGGLTWFGSGLFHQLHMNRLRASNGQAAVAAQFDSFAWSEKWIFVPAPLLVIATAITMVLVDDAWSFSQPWVYLSLALWVVAAIMGGAVGGKTMGQINETRERGGDVAPLVDRYLSLAWIDVAILVSLLALMVFKPGLQV